MLRPVQRSNEMYERHLKLKGRGFPLWISHQIYGYQFLTAEPKVFVLVMSVSSQRLVVLIFYLTFVGRETTQSIRSNLSSTKPD
jgi:hypothetical protein